MATLIIGTYRDHEVGQDHPLRLALGEIPARSMVEMRLPPLTVAAVEGLAGRKAAVALHAATAGNPCPPMSRKLVPLVPMMLVTAGDDSSAPRASPSAPPIESGSPAN